MADTEVTTLLERCRQGNELAWEALVRMYQSRVYAVALQYVRQPDEARALAQDIFIKLPGWTSWEEVRSHPRR